MARHGQGRAWHGTAHRKIHVSICVQSCALEGLWLDDLWLDDSKPRWLNNSHDRCCTSKPVIDYDCVFCLLELYRLNIRPAQVVPPITCNELKSVKPRRDLLILLVITTCYYYLLLLLAHQKTFPIGKPVVPSTSGKSDPKSVMTWRMMGNTRYICPKLLHAAAFAIWLFFVVLWFLP